MIYRENEQEAKAAFDKAAVGLHAMDAQQRTVDELNASLEQQLVELQSHVSPQYNRTMNMLGWAIILSVTAVLSFLLGGWIGWLGS